MRRASWWTCSHPSASDAHRSQACAGLHARGVGVVVMGVAVLWTSTAPRCLRPVWPLALETHVYAVLAGLALVAVLLWFRRVQSGVAAGLSGQLLASLSCYLAMLSQIGRSDHATVPSPFPSDARLGVARRGNVVAVIALGALVAFALRQRPRAPALLVWSNDDAPRDSPRLDCGPDRPLSTIRLLRRSSGSPRRGCRRATDSAAPGSGASSRRLRCSSQMPPRWTDDELPNRQLAKVAVGRVWCGLSGSGTSLVRALARPHGSRLPDRCDPEPRQHSGRRQGCPR